MWHLLCIHVKVAICFQLQDHPQLLQLQAAAALKAASTHRAATPPDQQPAVPAQQLIPAHQTRQCSIVVKRVSTYFLSLAIMQTLSSLLHACFYVLCKYSLLFC